MELDPQLLDALKQSVPDWVHGIIPRETLTSNGDSAIVLFLLVDPGSDVFDDGAKQAEAREAIAAVFRRQQLAWWPYVRFVNEAEWRASG